MTGFTQPQNRENDLRVVLEGYEGVLEKSKNWIAESFQKDAIQNSWDARKSKKGKNWVCKILLINSSNTKFNDCVVVTDMGTFGLTGKIPENKEHLIQILQEENKNDRLAFFLSSNWSNKQSGSLGTRGRGKMLFLGMSKSKLFYFESLRSDDNRYIFGKVLLDNKTKEVNVEFFSDDIAHKKREEIFCSHKGRLTEPGTRIFIINPKDRLKESFESGDLELFIQQTWWEILYKYNVGVEIIIGGKRKTVEPSPWLPVKKIDSDYKYDSGLISVENVPCLRIKNISFIYLGEKDIPDSYQGMSVQRGGMTIQRILAGDLINEKICEKIYGSVELEEGFEKKIREDEGPEHCTIFWQRAIPRKLRNAIKKQLGVFIHKYKLVDNDEEKNIKKKFRDAANKAEKELNALGKQLKLTGVGFGGSSIFSYSLIKKSSEKIRLSLADLEMPNDGSRVNNGQMIKGVYAIPINHTGTAVRVFIKARIYNENGNAIKRTEEELVIPTEEISKIGWEQVKIDSTFLPGKYTFKAEMFSLEDKVLNSGLKLEKGVKIYHSVSRNFYVEVDPPEREGLFKIQGVTRDDKEKYIWLEPDGNKGYLLCYNLRHPTINNILKKEEEIILQDALIKEGLLFLFTLRISEDIASIKSKKKPIFYNDSEILKNDDFERVFELLTEKRSFFLWERDGNKN